MVRFAAMHCIQEVCDLVQVNHEEKSAARALAVDQDRFNLQAKLPYGLTVEHLFGAMNDFVDFLSVINVELVNKGFPRLESVMMPANFSSLVSEFMKDAIPKHCPGLVLNQYHNGHPDLLPEGEFDDAGAQHASVGVEVKASRYKSGWQGHNPENSWLMVFCFDSNRPGDARRGKRIDPKPFRFVGVYGAQLSESDWRFSGRAEGSKRTITASVIGSGYLKMTQNWIYSLS